VLLQAIGECSIRYQKKAMSKEVEWGFCVMAAMLWEPITATSCYAQ
jgi:hypothetical protein